jgi:hypothetical protein
VQIRKRYWFGLLALLSVGTILVLSLPPGEPEVRGHPLTYWLDQLRPDNRSQLGNRAESVENIQSAIGAMDDRCIIALIEELDWNPSPAISTVNRFSGRWFHIMRVIPESPDRRSVAALILGKIGSRATNAIPALERISRVPSGTTKQWEDLRGSAMAALILIRHDSVEACARKMLDSSDPACDDYRYAIFTLGTNAALCVPIFVNAAQTATNNLQKQTAALGLLAIHSRPELSLPPLVSMLKETNPGFRAIGLLGLGAFGSAAKPAWNDLVLCLNDPDPSVRRRATNTLRMIDLDAAQKLGMVGP